LRAGIDVPAPGGDDRPVPQPASLGAAFARALAAKDDPALRGLMHPEIDFRGMTPNRTWEASDPDAVLAVLLGKWFEPADEIQGLERLDSDTFADRLRVGYRFSVSNPDGRFLVEQQAYLSARDGRIGWMRVMCSGFRAATAPEERAPVS
jgi:hypothetical protein